MYVANSCTLRGVIFLRVPWDIFHEMAVSLEARKRRWAYLFIAFPIVYFLGVRIFPMLYSFNISFREWDILSPDKAFTGLRNFTALFASHMFWKALRNTFLYTLVIVPTGLVLGLLIALALNSITRAVVFFRILYFAPFVSSLVAIGFIWKWIYDPTFGWLNIILQTLSLPRQSFLQDPSQVLLSIAAMTIWHGLGFQVIIFLAGLRSIPDMYYEAARVDGASPRQVFWNITIPLLNPTLIFLTITSAIQSLRMFTQVFNMTFPNVGGPLQNGTTLVLEIYQEAFHHFKMGYASAMTVILFCLIMTITLVQFKFFSKKVEY
ncbi:ABC transporter permease [candidate division KSB3 bacterium]|uniref:ABC transporter permease n=1 Tax=candidate division KSB3 bacterium TaxID=2044937 RepID=A0A2G6E127_9BACT|nr:MAG: ABC transporter permease [candidate division KSB3 bacterium]PIE30348.1 MAG: ABC transporter permease [candidate division KSB3 bacterium]